MRSTNIDSKTKNWYSDKYNVANIQRNILFLLILVLSIGIFIAILLVKYVYENKSVEPYLIEIDKKTGQATVVDSQTIEQFTGSEIIKESFVIQYIKARETYKNETVEDNKNFIRVTSAPELYSLYNSNSKLWASSELKDNEKAAKIEISIRSVLFVSSTIAEVKITKNIILDGKLLRKKYFKIRVSFAFYDLEFPIEDRYLNPLGFQVSSYIFNEERVSDDYDPEKDDKKPGSNSANTNSTPPAPSSLNSATS